MSQIPMTNFRLTTVIPPTLLLAFSALFSRLLGVYRDHLLAKVFGATNGTGIYNLDTYYAAFRIPDLLYNLLIFGAISAAFIPIFTRYKKSGELKKAWEFASSMLHLMLIAILTLSALAYLFAPYLAQLVAAGFPPEAYQLTVKLMRIMLISPILFTFSAVFISIQDSFKSFFFRSLAPLFYNAGIILGILIFGSQFGVVGVTWGVILGALFQLLIQIPSLIFLKYRHEWILGWRRPDVRRALKLIGPRVLGLSLMQLTLLANTLIASFLVTGSITIFYLADNLQALPIGIVGISFAITSFATLSELATESSKAPFTAELKRVIHRILFLIIPATAGLFLLRDQVIDVILVYGNFTAQDAFLMSDVLGFLLLSLFAQSLIPLLSRAFYAYHETRTPLLAAFAGATVTVGGSFYLALIVDLGVVGIGLATSFGFILNFLLLYLGMTKRLKSGIVDVMSIFKMLLASGFMLLITLQLMTWLPYQGSILNKALYLGVYVVAGALVYFAISYILRVPETSVIAERLKRRLNF
jgi:putative peptidoglycan lipid II flippase